MTETTEGEVSPAFELRKLRPIAVPSVLAVIVALAYCGSLTGGFVYDDALLIERNSLIQGPLDLGRIFSSGFWEFTPTPSEAFFRPLVVLSYALNHGLGGMDAFGFRVCNLAVHIGNVLLVHLVVRQFGARPWLAAAAGLFFGLHPIATEAVAWISSRSDLMATFFGLAGLAVHVRTYPPGGREGRTARAAPRALGAFCLFLALLCKESAVTWIAVLILYEIALGPVSARRCTHLWPVLVPVVACVVWRSAVLDAAAAAGIQFLKNPLVEADLATRIFTGVKIVGLYLYLLAFPVPLAADYSYDSIALVATPWDAGVIASALAIAVVAGAGVWSWRRCRLAFLGLGWFVATASPAFANSLFPYGNIVAERYMYPASAGIIFAAVVLAWKALANLAAPSRVQVSAAVAAVLLLAYGFKTWTRSLEWRDTRAIFAAAVAVNPRSALAHNNLGDQLVEGAQYSKAEEHFRRAVEIHPGYEMPRIGLGKMALRRGKPAEAVQHLEQARKLRPDRYEVSLSLAEAYFALGDTTRARAALEWGMERNPEDGRLFTSLAVVEMQSGRPDRAVALWTRALELNPADFLALANLGMYYESTGREALAAECFRKFLDVAPPGHERLKQRARAYLKGVSRRGSRR